jgi:hypothetical protein
MCKVLERSGWPAAISSVGLSLCFLVLNSDHVRAQSEMDPVDARIFEIVMIIGAGVACSGNLDRSVPAAEHLAADFARAYPGRNIAASDLEGLFRSTAADLIPEIEASGGEIFEKRCSHWQVYLDAVAAGELPYFSRALADPDTTDSEPAEPEATPTEMSPAQPIDDAALQRLAEIAKLPGGYFAHLLGCWEGPSTPISYRFCLSENGDVIDITLAAPDRQYCEFKDGVARKVGDGLSFHLIPKAGRCGDGGTVFLLEGICFEEPPGLSCATATTSSGSTFLLPPRQRSDFIPMSRVD